MGFFDKIKEGLAKTRNALSNTLGSVFSGFSEIDDDFYDEIEDNGISGESLCIYLEEKYSKNEISAYEIERIWKKYGEKE